MTSQPIKDVSEYKRFTPLETFLAKVDNCAEYYSWTEREKLHHLRASLDGAAGQVLWDAGSQTSVKDIVRLLRNRFGSQHQAERFRAELRARRRQKGESLQTVYQGVRRLIALAFPGESGSLYENCCPRLFSRSNRQSRHTLTCARAGTSYIRRSTQPCHPS